MSKKRVMIVAGGEWQVPIIKKAKELGYYVINTNLYEKSPGFEYADVGVVANVLDKETNLAIAREYKPDAIITDQSDIAVPTVAYICEKMGLSGIGTDKAELFTNKLKMREFCRDNGFPYPQFKLCGNFDEIKEFSGAVGFPFILKPLDNQSSRGVNKVMWLGDLLDMYKNTLSHSRDGIILAEEYMAGTELTVEGIKTKEKHFTLAISEKDHLQENPSVAYRLFYTPKNPNIDYDGLEEVHNNLVEKMGLPFGITHAEYMFWKNDFHLVEIAARGGGTKISSHIAPLISGIDTNKMLIKMALGEEVQISMPHTRDKCAVLQFFVLKPGKVKEIHGLEEIRAMKQVVDVGINFKPGDHLLPPEDDRSRPGFFIASEDNPLLLNELIEKIKSSLQVIYD